MKLEEIREKVKVLGLNYEEQEEIVFTGTFERETYDDELLSKVLYLMMKDDKRESDEEKFNDALTFLLEDGGIELYENVSSYQEIAKAQLTNDTDNHEKGSLGPIHGSIPANWAKYIDLEQLAEALAKDESIVFDEDLQLAIQFWQPN